MTCYNMRMSCIFCDIANKRVASKIVHETDSIVVIENIDPKAPIHLLVIPKQHVDKNECVRSSDGSIWCDMMRTTFDVVKKFGLDKTGYRLAVNGGGYQGVDHEHLHILGGKNWRPSDGL